MKQDRRKEFQAQGLLDRIEEAESSLFVFHKNGLTRSSDHHVEAELREICEGSQKDIEALIGIRPEDLDSPLKELSEAFDYERQIQEFKDMGVLTDKDVQPPSKSHLLASLAKFLESAPQKPRFTRPEVLILPRPINCQQALRLTGAGLDQDLYKYNVMTEEEMEHLRANPVEGELPWIEHVGQWMLRVAQRAMLSTNVAERGDW